MLSALLDLNAKLVSPLVQVCLLASNGVHLFIHLIRVQLLQQRHVGLYLAAYRLDSLLVSGHRSLERFHSLAKLAQIGRLRREFLDANRDRADLLNSVLLSGTTFHPWVVMWPRALGSIHHGPMLL